VTVELATEVASRVGALDGVVAVALGGSLERLAALSARVGDRLHRLEPGIGQ
jgi:hypothetical protein